MWGNENRMNEYSTRTIALMWMWNFMGDIFQQIEFCVEIFSDRNVRISFSWVCVWNMSNRVFDEIFINAFEKSYSSSISESFVPLCFHTRSAREERRLTEHPAENLSKQAKIAHWSISSLHVRIKSFDYNANANVTYFVCSVNEQHWLPNFHEHILHSLESVGSQLKVA